MITKEQQIVPTDRDVAACLIGKTPYLTRYAQRLTGSPADADDLVQDTLARCWAARTTLQPDSNIAAWATTVMRNCFISGRRRARFQRDLTDAAVAQLLTQPEPQEWAVHLGDARSALGELTATLREAVVLAAEGLTMEQGADRLSISVGAFKSRLLRGRLRLKSLSEDPDTPFRDAARARATAQDVGRQ